MVENERLFREAGVPAGSLKKYFAAGILSPDDLLTAHPVSLSERVGLSPGTIQRHAEMVAKARGKVPPARFTSAQVARGREELLSIPGLQDAELAKLQRAGVMSGRLLLAEDPAALSGKTGITSAKLKAYQAVLRERAKKAEPDIIVI
jgi:DNA topoisomerase-1